MEANLPNLAGKLSYQPGGELWKIAKLACFSIIQEIYKAKWGIPGCCRLNEMIWGPCAGSKFLLGNQKQVWWCTTLINRPENSWETQVLFEKRLCIKTSLKYMNIFTLIYIYIHYTYVYVCVIACIFPWYFFLKPHLNHQVVYWNSVVCPTKTRLMVGPSAPTKLVPASLWAKGSMEECSHLTFRIVSNNSCWQPKKNTFLFGKKKTCAVQLMQRV